MVFFFSKRDSKNVPTSLLAERAELLSLFKRCDVNKDGKLSKEEVKAGFQRLQSRFPGFRTQRAFKVADKNGDGFISETEPGPSLGQGSKGDRPGPPAQDP
ncbi:hypothetical protein V6N13_143126 [Hibiscus sabdariffa]|uniref:EF-hand domain-containing protein n=1 Tax=Hibiscus sabdariffa TaxID=183260 RepID=A0ABR2FGG7_9ROSI